VVVGLEGDLEGAPVGSVGTVSAAKADRLNGVKALVVLDLCALLDAGGGAHRVGRRRALALVSSDLNLSKGSVGPSCRTR